VSGHALYVYGVAAGAGVPEGNAGVDERYPVRVVAENGLHAIASEVPLEEFGQDRIGERLADPVWLEAKVRAHERVLETLSGATVVPLRFGAVFLGEEPVRAMLRERSALLRDALARVEGRREWGVKVLLDSDVLAAILHFEGAEAIDPGLDALEVFYQAGLRSLGPVWSRPNPFGPGVPFADRRSPDAGPGLTDAGRALVRACNRLRIMVDVSHLSEAGFWDVANVTQDPIVATHSNVHELCHVSRNLTDRL